MNTIIVPLSVTESNVILPLNISSNTELIPMELETKIVIEERKEYYEGSYDIIPTGEVQTLSTAELSMHENLVIEPIPQNYGLITWDGYHLIVS